MGIAVTHSCCRGIAARTLTSHIDSDDAQHRQQTTVSRERINKQDVYEAFDDATTDLLIETN